MRKTKLTLNIIMTKQQRKVKATLEKMVMDAIRGFIKQIKTLQLKLELMRLKNL